MYHPEPYQVHWPPPLPYQLSGAHRKAKETSHLPAQNFMPGTAVRAPNPNE